MKQSGLFSTTKGHIGTDESGKGDYFGPLVVAGFYLPEDQEDILTELGVRDSKKISDNRIKKIADVIRKGYKHSLVVIGPQKYNELYLKLRNLNKLLAWAHSRVIENLLEEIPCEKVITDQFGDKLFVINALMKRGKNIELIQRPKAEEDLAVAAASIIARAEFLKRMDFLSQDIGIEIPRGSSPQAEEAGAKIVKLLGAAVLDRIAKRHFKLTERILKTVSE